jgi:hypothetical protein
LRVSLTHSPIAPSETPIATTSRTCFRFELNPVAEALYKQSISGNSSPTSQMHVRLPKSIVDTVREPVMVLDKGLRVIAASRSFYSSFKVTPEHTQGRLLYTLGDGQWQRCLCFGLATYQVPI